MERILVIRLGAIGDVILASAPVLNLKLSFPYAEISLLTRHHIAGLAENMAGIDNVLPFPLKASPLDLFRMGEYLDSAGYDMVVDLHGNLRSYFLTRYIAAGVKVRYKKRRLERIQAVKLKKINPAPPHSIDLYNDAVKAAGGKIFLRRPLLRFQEGPPTDFPFNNSRPTLVVAPGASFPVKKWAEENYMSLICEAFRQFDCNIILALTGNEKGFDKLSENIPADRLLIMKNSELIHLAELIARSDLVVCNDSAVSHLGSSVGTPVIAIFGPTHPTLGFKPRGLHDVVVEVDEPCRPCSLHGRKPCYREKQYCFTRIGVDDVLEVITGRIGIKSKSRKAVFIDRDGTLIKEKGFLDRPEEVEPEDGSIEAVRLARQAGYKVIVLSNQSGVARGYFSEQAVRVVNERILDIFREARAPLDDILYCPHYPGGDMPAYNRECYCRKPAPGMIEEAAARHNINPFLSYTIGDKLSDVHLAYTSGARALLVETGYGRSEAKRLQGQFTLKPEKVVQNLLEGVKYIAETQNASV